MTHIATSASKAPNLIKLRFVFFCFILLPSRFLFQNCSEPFAIREFPDAARAKRQCCGGEGKDRVQKIKMPANWPAFHNNCFRSTKVADTAAASRTQQGSLEHKMHRAVRYGTGKDAASCSGNPNRFPCLPGDQRELGTRFPAHLT